MARQDTVVRSKDRTPDGRYRLESKIQSEFIDEVRERGGIAYKLICAGRRGFPDVMVLYDGQVVFVELKTKVGRTTKLQQYVHNELRRFGGDVVTVYGWDAAMELLDMIFGRTKCNPSTPTATKRKPSSSC